MGEKQAILQLKKEGNTIRAIEHCRQALSITNTTIWNVIKRKKLPLYKKNIMAHVSQSDEKDKVYKGSAHDPKHMSSSFKHG